jgi:hypothetical protein
LTGPSGGSKLGKIGQNFCPQFGKYPLNDLHDLTLKDNQLRQKPVFMRVGAYLDYRIPKPCVAGSIPAGAASSIREFSEEVLKNHVSVGQNWANASFALFIFRAVFRAIAWRGRANSRST